MEEIKNIKLDIIQRLKKISFENLIIQIIAILIALFVGAIVLVLSNHSVTEAYYWMIIGAFGSTHNFGQTLTQATPIVFTSIAFLIGLKTGLFNIGIEGQFLMGALCSSLAGIYLTGLPWILHIPVTLVAGIIGGAFWALIPAFLKARFEAHEVITTMMLTYVATYFTSYLVNYPFKAPGWVAQTERILPSAELIRILPPTQLSTAIIIALMLTLASKYFLNKSILGYELKAIGLNPSAAENAGISINKGIIISFVLSGAIAGLGGACEIMGIHRRFIQGFSPGYGWDGIAVSLVGSMNPIGCFLASILFGAFRNGGKIMTRTTGVSLDLVNILQALVILFVAAPKLIKTLLRRKN